MDETIDREAQAIERAWQRFVGPWLLGTEPSDSFKRLVRVLWERALNWHTMTELNRRYLQRRLPVCAGYGSPPDEETGYFMNLLRLHDYGIISTNSCPGWEKKLHASPAFTRQRAYLNFSIPTRAFPANTSNELLDFIHKLMKSEEVYACIRFKYEDAPDGVQRDPDINGLMKFGNCNSFPNKKSEEWIEEKWASDCEYDHEDCENDHEDCENDHEVFTYYVTQEQIRQDSEGPWEFLGHDAIEMSGSDFNDDDNPFPASHAADPLQVYVFAKYWYYREIGQLIEQLLIDSGFVPGFVPGFAPGFVARG